VEESNTCWMTSKSFEDPNKVDVLEPNNAFTLIIHGIVKYMLDDY
jgi:hypothetical protein